MHVLGYISIGCSGRDDNLVRLLHGLRRLNRFVAVDDRDWWHDVLDCLGC